MVNQPALYFSIVEGIHHLRIPESSEQEEKKERASNEKIEPLLAGENGDRIIFSRLERSFDFQTGIGIFSIGLRSNNPIVAAQVHQTKQVE